MNEEKSAAEQEAALLAFRAEIAQLKNSGKFSSNENIITENLNNVKVEKLDTDDMVKWQNLKDVALKIANGGEEFLLANVNNLKNVLEKLTKDIGAPAPIGNFSEDIKGAFACFLRDQLTALTIAIGMIEIYGPEEDFWQEIVGRCNKLLNRG